MRKIQHTTEFRGFGETSWESGGSGVSSSGQDLIAKANKVPLTDIFRFYGITIGASNKITCPFPSHSRGREKTPSFKFYRETNSFYCYGCGTGGSTVSFVCNMDNCKSSKAASKVISLYGSDEEIGMVPKSNHHEILNLHMEFSNYIYDFIQKNKNKEAIQYAEKITKIFDDLCNKKDMCSKKLESIIFKLKNQIDRY